MPYPESCPECGGAFRNSGTHFTARRNEIGRHVLLELGCQNTTRRFWWDFTSGNGTEDGRPAPLRRLAPTTAAAASATNGLHRVESGLGEANGYALLSTMEPPARVPLAEAVPGPRADADFEFHTEPEPPTKADAAPADSADANPAVVEAVLSPAWQEEITIAEVAELVGPPPVAPPTLKDAFVRQLQLDRLTLRQMRSWLMSDEARRAIEVAAGATEATYERLALILFGAELPQLLGKQAAPPPSTGMSAEERLELQREKARIRARLRRAAAKAARPQN